MNCLIEKWNGGKMEIKRIIGFGGSIREKISGYEVRDFLHFLSVQVD